MAPPKDDLLSVGAVDLLRSWESPVFAQQETIFRSYLTDNKLVSAADRETALVRALAVAQILHQFEQIYGAIWYSQTELLLKLNNYTATGGMARDAVEAHYLSAKTAFPAQHATDTLDDYLGFLADVRLILLQDGAVIITDRGRQFLRFLIDQRKQVGRLVG